IWVAGGGLRGGGASSGGGDEERTLWWRGGTHLIKNSVEFSLGGGSGGHRIDPRPPHKYDGETALRACWVRDPRFPRLRRGRTGARRQRATMKKGVARRRPLGESDF